MQYCFLLFLYIYIGVIMERDKLAYPLSRYWYGDGFRFYYAYGNTPAQDFLQNCPGETEPYILVLGCGDIRSCFYSLWKNFDSISCPRFDGVHFVLNDISAAVLARNVLFLYLCLRMPEEEGDMKKWLSGMWAIWYCHELYPDHHRLLRDSLGALCKFSADWLSSKNPLYPMVKFTSAATLCEVHKVWKMWLEGDVNISSVEAMHTARQSGLARHRQVLRTDAQISDYVMGCSVIPYETPSNRDKTEAQISEVRMYCKTGSAYAENVLEVKLSGSRTSVNFTLFERDDGKYSLHYRSLPFSCYYQTLDFTREVLKFPTLLVKDEYFKSLPFLSNSVQQFCLWLQSAHKVLKTFKHKQNICFTFDCSNAMTYCLQKPQEFDLIYSSNLMDHVGPPNLILSAVALLKEGGFLFTTSLLKDFSYTFSTYLTESFGFDSKLFPIFFGVRCINYEGDGYASPVAVRPVPFAPRELTCAHYEKVQVWEKVSSGTLPLVFGSNQPLTDTITEALLGCVRVSVYPLLKTPRIPHISNHLCVETAVNVFRTFMSNCHADYSPQFWRPLSDAMQAAVKPYLHSIQTQLLLHGIHMHLTVTEDDCPICLQVPVSSSVGLFCVRTPLEIDHGTPNFFVAVHKEGFDNATHLCNIARESGRVHLFDCISSSSDYSDIIELCFYAPVRLSQEGYKATLICASMGDRGSSYYTESSNYIFNMPRVCTVELNSWLTASSIFYFSQPVLPSSKDFKLASFGAVTSHASDGDASEVKVSLLERVFRISASNKLQTKKISYNEIQVLFGKVSCFLKYPYPVDYDKTNIRFSKSEKILIIRCPRLPQQFQNEKPLFIVDPDRLLAHYPSAEVLRSMSGQQFILADRVIQSSCADDFSDAPPLIGLKNTLMFFCQQKDVHYYQFLLPKDGVHGMVLVNKRMYDYENRVPVVDLAFCFLEESFVRFVAPIWVRMTSKQSHNLKTSDSEYKLLKEVFFYFAGRTNVTCNKFDAKSRLRLLTKHGIQKYFTRAIVSFLLYDPDIYREFVLGIAEGTKDLKGQCAKDSVATTATCDNCGARSEAVKFCAACRMTKYCSRECQKNHWRVHKHHCTRKPGDEKRDATANVSR
jgi:hypothetical protein